MAAVAAAAAQRLAVDARQPGTVLCARRENRLGAVSTVIIAGERWTCRAIPSSDVVTGLPPRTLPGQQHGGPARPAAKVLHPLLGCRLGLASSEQVFESQLAANRPPILGDHKIQGQVIMPGAGYLEMALAASAAVARQAVDRQRRDAGRTAALGQNPQNGPDHSFRPKAHARHRFASSASCSRKPTIRADIHHAGHGPARSRRVVKFRLRSNSMPTAAGFPTNHATSSGRSRRSRKSGLEPGPTFLWISRHWVDQHEGLGELRAVRDADRARRISDSSRTAGLRLSTARRFASRGRRGDRRLCAVGRGSDSGFSIVLSRRPGAWRRYDRPTVSWPSVIFNYSTHRADSLQSWKACDCGVSRAIGWPGGWPDRRPIGVMRLAWPSHPLDSVASAQTTAESNAWLIFDSREALGSALAARLEMKGHRATVVPAGIDADGRQAATREFLSSDGAGHRGVVYLSGLDVLEPCDAPDFDAAQRRLGWRFGCSACGWPNRQRLDAGPIVDRDPRRRGRRRSSASGEPGPVAPVGPRTRHRGRTSYARTARESISTCEDPERPVDRLIEELFSTDGEDQVVYRGAERHVARLRRRRRTDAARLRIPSGQPYRLEITCRGQLDNVVACGRQRACGLDRARWKSRCAPPA